MKSKIQKMLLLIVGLLASINVSAETFVVGGITYNVTSSTTVEVSESAEKITPAILLSHRR